LRRYALGLAVRSALRFFAALKKLGLAYGHPAASLGQGPLSKIDCFLAWVLSFACLKLKKKNKVEEKEIYFLAYFLACF